MPFMPQKMKQINVPARPVDRMLAFLAEYQAVDHNDEMELRIGRMGEDQATSKPAIVITLKGKQHGFTSSEARTIANMADDALRQFPDYPNAAGLPNLILLLRIGAAKADAAKANGEPQ